MQKTRKVTISNITYISPIQMDGPIVTPLTLSESIVRDLVRRGYTVIEEVNGYKIRLTPCNFDNPAISIPKEKPEESSQVHTKANTMQEKRFSNNAPVVPNKPAPTPKPVVVEPPKEETKPVDYDFGKDVEEVDTSISEVVEIDTAIAPDEEAVGRLFTGRSIPDVSPDVKAITEVDISQEGTVEAGNVNTAQETSSENAPTNNSGNLRNTNRLQGKRKHKKS